MFVELVEWVNITMLGISSEYVYVNENLFDIGITKIKHFER